MIKMNPRKTISLPNVACVYCGKQFGVGFGSTKDHVIARRLVPDGAMSQSWNIILKACAPCNQSKSTLEAEVSAITMQPDAIGRFACNDDELKAASVRKAAGAQSSVTGVSVAGSHTQTRVELPFGTSALLTFSFKGPPVLSDDASRQLAYLQLVAIFYFITFDTKLRLGGYWPGIFCLANIAHRSDWGNPVAVDFQKKSQSWDLRFCGVAARGFFKVVVRKLPEPEPVWGWALEWNENYRLVGFFGHEAVIRQQLSSLPQLTWQAAALKDGGRLYSRVETQLKADDDRLFCFGD